MFYSQNNTLDTFMNKAYFGQNDIVLALIMYGFFYGSLSFLRDHNYHKTVEKCPHCNVVLLRAVLIVCVGDVWISIHCIYLK